MPRYKINAFTGKFDLDSNSSGGSSIEDIGTDNGTAFPVNGTVNILGGIGTETTASGDSVIIDITNVPTANGGTGQDFGSATGLISLLSGVASATLTPSVTSITISNAPVAPTDGANKAYVDLIAAGFSPKVACLVGTTANLTATYNNGASGIGATLTNSGAQAALVINGVTLAVNDRVLVKDQSTTSQNGIYYVSNIGSGATNWVLTRATDFDQPSEMTAFSIVATISGDIEANTFWYLTDSVVTVGTTPVVWGAFLQEGILTLTGNSGVASGTNVTVSGGNNITTTGSGSTLSVAVTGTTNHAIQLGNSTGSLSSLGLGSSGQLLQSGGGSSDPAWTTATYPSTATSAGTILRSNGTNWLASTSTFADTYAVSTLLYASSANTVSGLATANNATLTTNGSGVPSWTTTSSGFVTSITGTANQVIASASTGAVTLSLPQSIATSSTPQFARLGLGVAADATASLKTTAAIYVPDGSNSSPSYAFTNSTGTGMYSSGANALNFATSSTNWLSINSSGTVTALSGNFNLGGASIANPTITLASATGGNWFINKPTSSSSLSFYNSGDQLLLDTSGNGTFAGTITSSGDSRGFVTGANSNLKISSSGGDSTINARNFANTAQLVIPMGTGNSSVMRISESTATGSARAGFGVGDWYLIQDLGITDAKTLDIYDNANGASRFSFDTSGNGTFAVRAISPAFRMTTGATNGYIIQGDASGNFSWVAPGSATVTTVQGTANQVLANGTSGTPQSGAVIVTTPQDIGTSSSVTFGQLNVDNLRLDGNTISSTNTSGDINIYPDSGGTLRCNSVVLISNSELIRNDNNDAFSNNLSFQKSTNNGNTANGCELGYINFAGYANSNYQTAARIIVNQQGSSSGSNVPSQMSLLTSDTSGLRSVLNANSGGDLTIQVGDLYIGNDNKSLVLGTGNDAKFYYDGTNAVINPKSVGSGYLSVLGQIYSESQVITNTATAYGLHVTGTSSTSTGNEQCGIRVSPILTGASLQNVTGVYSIPTFQNTGGFNAIGASFFADFTLAGNNDQLGTAYGFYAYCQGGTTGKVFNAYGLGVLAPVSGGTNSCAIFSGGNSGFKKPAPTHTLELGDDDAAKTTTTTWTTTSDARIKKDIETVDSGLGVIKALRPVKYKHTEEFIHHLDIAEKSIYKNESDYHRMRAKKSNGCPNTTYYGFVADEVEQVMPSCVTTSSECVGEHEGIKKFNMHNILVMMVKAVQELSAKVEDLESRLASKGDNLDVQ